MKNTFLFIVSWFSIWSFLCCTPNKFRNVNKTQPEHISFSELDSLMHKETRPIAIFIYTDWCKYCKNMEVTTFKDDKIVNLLNNQFYFISFDGEQKESIEFNGQLFEFQATGRHTGIHALTESLGAVDDELSYPIFVILNSQKEIIFQNNTYLNSSELIAVLKAANMSDDHPRQG